MKTNKLTKIAFGLAFSLTGGLVACSDYAGDFKEEHKNDYGAKDATDDYDVPLYDFDAETIIWRGYDGSNYNLSTVNGEIPKIVIDGNASVMFKGRNEYGVKFETNTLPEDITPLLRRAGGISGTISDADINNSVTFVFPTQGVIDFSNEDAQTDIVIAMECGSGASVDLIHLNKHDEIEWVYSAIDKANVANACSDGVVVVPLSKFNLDEESFASANAIGVTIGIGGENTDFTIYGVGTSRSSEGYLSSESQSGDEVSSSSESTEKNSSSEESSASTAKSSSSVKSSSSTAKSSSSTAKSSSSEKVVSWNWDATDGWDMNIDGDAGSWYTYTDKENGGRSYIQWPNEIGADEPLSNGIPSSVLGICKGICGEARLLKNSSDQSSVQVSFKVTDNPSGRDVNDWQGVCIAYTSEADAKLLAYDVKLSSTSVTLPATGKDEYRVMNLKWSDFSELTGSFSNLGHFAFTYTSTTEQNSYFNIYAVGSYGACSSVNPNLPTVTFKVNVDDYLNPNITYGTMTDNRDFQVYKTVKIGELTWMAQNLNYAYSLPTAELDSSSFCYDNDPKNCEKYGRLYLWSAAMDSATTSCGNGVNCDLDRQTQGVCPAGWHLPSDTEWKNLIANVADSSVAGTYLKTTREWNDGGNGSDSFGFSALPAGYRNYNGNLRDVGKYGSFWSSSDPFSNQAYYWGFGYNYENVRHTMYPKNGAFSVRCVQDYTPSVVEDVIREGGVCYSREIETIGSVKDTMTSALSFCPDSLKTPITNCSCTADVDSLFTGETATWTVSGCSSTEQLTYEWTGISGAGYEATATHEFTDAESATPTLKVSNADGVNVNVTCPAVKTIKTDYTNPALSYGTMTDSRDGQIYKTKKIGSLTWMAQNLNYAYNQPTSTLDSSSFCYDNDPKNCKIYGRMYLWSAAMDSAAVFSTAGQDCGYDKTCDASGTVRGVCPAGWHLPKKAEWNSLIATAGGKINAVLTLKSLSGWSNNGNGTDSYGFAALPAGSFYDCEGDCFLYEKDEAHFWSSTEESIISSYYYFLSYEDDRTETNDGRYKDYARSVRCVKDYTPNVVTEEYAEGNVCYSRTIETIGTVKDTTVTQLASCMGTLTDSRDNQTYKTVRIGTQVWMAENLNYNYEAMATKNLCYSNSDANCDTYGRLYTWSAAIDSVRLEKDHGLTCGFGKSCNLASVGRVQGVCPTGWHLPDSTEYNTLRSYVGSSRDGYKLMSAGGVWEDNSGNAVSGSDEYGFSALPAGRLNASKNPFDLGRLTYFWTSSQSFNGDAKSSSVTEEHDAAFYWLAGDGITQSGSYYHSYVRRDNNSKGFYFSVRCLQD